MFNILSSFLGTVGHRSLVALVEQPWPQSRRPCTVGVEAPQPTRG